MHEPIRAAPSRRTSQRAPALATWASAALLLATALAGCGDDDASDTSSNDFGTGLIGQDMTLAGNVAGVVNTTAFHLSGTVAGQTILVLHADEADLKAGDRVTVTGTLRQFNLADLERETGIDLDDDLLRGMTGRPVIVADAVAPDGATTTTRATTITTTTTTTTRAAGTTSTSATTAPGAVPALTQECSFVEAGRTVGVSYPDGWHVNPTTRRPDGGTIPPCRIFHHEPFSPSRSNELIEYDVFVRVDNVEYARVRDSEDPNSVVLSSTQTTVDGREGTRREARTLEDGLSGPAGTRRTLYAVDLDGVTLIAITYDVADLDYDRNVEVLEAMVAELSIGR